MATYIRIASGRRIVINASGFCSSQRLDNPYLTQSGTITTRKDASVLAATLYGKSTNGSLVGRDRFGVSFPIPSDIRGINTATLLIRVNNFVNTLESFVPVVFFNGTDDSSLYSTTTTKATWDWELASSVTGSGSLVYGVTSVQSIDVPLSSFTPILGTHFSIVIGETQEMNNTGLGSSVGTKQSQFKMGFGVGSTPPFQLVLA